jgi:protein phosphatase
MVVKTLASRLSPAPVGAALDDTVQAAVRALNEASYRIRDMADERGVSSVGSTVVVLVLDRIEARRAVVLHAGDSRAYRWRAGRMERLTEDHSIASAVGVSGDEELPPMLRGVITNAVGIQATVDLDKTGVEVQAGDIFLLCSDGLTRELRDREIREAIGQAPGGDLTAMARALIDQANAAGGEDNLSAVLVRVDALPRLVPDAEEGEALTDMTSAVAFGTSSVSMATTETGKADEAAPGQAPGPKKQDD